MSDDNFSLNGEEKSPFDLRIDRLEALLKKQLSEEGLSEEENNELVALAQEILPSDSEPEFGTQQASIKQTSDEAKQKMNDIDDEFHARFEALQEKGARVKEKREAVKQKQAKDADPHNIKGLGIGLTAGYALVGCMIVGFGVGWLLDRGTGGNAWQAGLGLLGCLVGLGFSMYLIQRNQP